ncbi:hypothetical protein MSLAZ_1709 [Methanosarcina lacustris Z-7289]|uniref:Uncharacterized protein n=1 Tax=Methanosarcina lacustris Z-7289 TaxID=1434111 RepID=A0A0E3WRS6_9EURY|nr:hypothetical protein [Methanosarcina lacustris]AKB74970.1 hypothetical protein MSLAZ_1709 [Methanosarcina lacustris Z-7289]
MDIHFLAKLIEQIEEATAQIDKNTPTGSRLALILIDNAIEISMWNITNYERSNEDYIEIINGTFKDPYSDFRAKTKFLVSDSIITSGTKNIFDICHHFRNEVYHKNIMKDLIINDLAKIYLETYCGVMLELLDSSFSIDYRKPVPQILIKYGIKSNPFCLTTENINEIISIFLNNRLCSHRNFSQTLASDIEKRINKVWEDINSIESLVNEKIPSRLETEKRTLDSFSRRAHKLNCVLDVSNALTRYLRIDIDLIPIEYRIDFILAMLDEELDRYREDQYTETFDFP